MVRGFTADEGKYLMGDLPNEDARPQDENQATGTAVSTAPKGAQALTAVFGDLDDQVGAGFENMVPSRDMLIPRVTILQALSPQLDRRKPGQFIDGARVGDICDVSSGTIFEAPLRVVLAAFQVLYLEWAPRNSTKGLVEVHQTEPKDTVTDPATNKRVRPNGNLIVMSAQYYAVLPDHECRKVFIPMSSTQFKKAKGWNNKLGSERFIGKDGVSKQAPIWMRSWDLGVIPESNNQGSWEGWIIAPGPFTAELPNAYDVAQAVKDLRDAVNQGLTKVDQEDAVEGTF